MELEFITKECVRFSTGRRFQVKRIAETIGWSKETETTAVINIYKKNLSLKFKFS